MRLRNGVKLLFIASALLLFRQGIQAQQQTTQALSPGENYGADISFISRRPTGSRVSKIPAAGNRNKIYKILTVIISNSQNFGDDGFEYSPLSIDNVSALYNARRQASQTNVEFRRSLPYRNWTSVSEYFTIQSNSKFKVNASVIKLARNKPSRETTIPTYSLGFRDYFMRQVSKALIEEFSAKFYNSFDAYQYIIYDQNATRSFIALDNTHSIYTTFENDLPVRYPCMGVANSILSLDSLADQAIAGFCLMGTTFSSKVAADSGLADVREKQERHPPNLNPMYKSLLGWIDVIELDENTIGRFGVLHEGPIAYKYAPLYPAKSGADKTKNWITGDGTRPGNISGGQQTFFFESRMNDNYEGGSVINASSRGVIDPDAPSNAGNDFTAPVSPVGPGRTAGGLAMYFSYYDEQQGRVGGPRVLDQRLNFESNWNNSLRPSLFQQNYMYALLNLNTNTEFFPWPNAIGDALFKPSPEVVLEYKDTDKLLAGQFNSDLSPNPAGGYILSKDNPTDNDPLYNPSYKISIGGDIFYACSKKPWTAWPNPIDDIATYDKTNTYPGQFNAIGEYIPNGQYILKGDSYGSIMNVLAAKVDKSEIILEPNGNGYYDANGNYAPGGGFEPNLNVATGQIDWQLRAKRQFISDPLGVGTFRVWNFENNIPLNSGNDLPGNFALQVADTSSEDKNKIFKNEVGMNTSPTTEFASYKFKSDNGQAFSSATIYSFFGTKYGKPALDQLMPMVSNISQPRATTTFEICSQEKYNEYGGTNGFLNNSDYQFRNELGITLLPEKLSKDHSKYEQYSKGLYNEYVETLNLDYGQRPQTLRFGIWNKGGQTLPFTVITKNEDLLNFHGAGNIEQVLVGNNSATYTFDFDVDKFIRLNAGNSNKPFPWETKIHVAEIRWTYFGYPGSKGTTRSSDVYIDLQMKSPGQLLVGANANFKDPEKPTVTATLELAGPIYAKTITDNIYILNTKLNDETINEKGGSTVRVWANAAPVGSNKTGEYFSTPRTIKRSNVTGETYIADKIYQWVGPDSYLVVPVTLDTKKYLTTCAKPFGTAEERSTAIYVYSDDRDINTRSSVNDTSGPLLSTNVRVNISNTDNGIKPPEPSNLKLYTHKQYENYIRNHIIPEIGYDSLTYDGSRTYFKFTPVAHVDYYAIYLSNENKAEPSEADLFTYVKLINREGIISFLPRETGTVKMWIRPIGVNSFAHTAIIDELFNMENLDVTQYALLYTPERIKEFTTLINEDLTINGDNLIARNFFPGKLSRSMSMTFGKRLPPDEVTASTNKTRKITVSWNYTEEPDNIFYIKFEVWRGTSRNFDEAMHIATVEQFVDMYDDINVETLPKVYYYWVKAIDLTNNEASGPSSSVLGSRLVNSNDFIPVVDNTLDKDVSFFDSTTGSVITISRPDGTRDEEDTMIRMAANNGGATRNNNTNLTSSVVKFMNFSDLENSNIVMHFDYKFEDTSKGGFMRVLVGGKTLFSKNAAESPNTWSSTGNIDLSAFAGSSRVKIEIQMTCDALYPTQAVWFDNLYIGAKLILPCWQMISSPRADKTLKDLLKVPFSYSDTLFSWDKENNNYGTLQQLDTQKLESTAGYWFFLGEPLTSEDIDVGKKDERTHPAESMLNNVTRGWNMAGPVENTILRDRKQVTNIDANSHYLNDYPNIANLVDTIVYDEEGKQVVKPLLTPNCTFWKWSTTDEYYIEENDKLEVGRAYWIFKY